MALDTRTRRMDVVIPRETLRLVRGDVLKGLGQTVALAPAPAPAPVVAPAPAPIAARVPIASPPTMKACSPIADPRLMMLADPKGTQAAAFRFLRDSLVAKGLPRVLAVSSPASEDGATTCAINLALAIAEQRTDKTLLLDANFAAPAIAGLLGIDAATLAAPCSAPFTLSALTPSLHVATLARQAGEPPPYVDFTTLARLLDTFQRAGYHHIILDAAPVDSSPEAGLPLHLSGGVLLAVRSGRSTTSALRRAAERLGPKALGVTLMDAPP